ncbi:hypothetical protein C4Q26_01685 [Pseudomonas sp. SWI44]|nr:hypothetical protein C4Q26_01685 [Pseudomonas sp. SWI44]
MTNLLSGAVATPIQVGVLAGIVAIGLILLFISNLMYAKVHEPSVADESTKEVTGMKTLDSAVLKTSQDVGAGIVSSLIVALIRAF